MAKSDQLETTASLRFVVGRVDANTGERIQMSSTWLIRATVGPDLYILPLELGGDSAHISLHQDGSCHFKVAEPPDRSPKIIKTWDLPGVREGTQLARLVDIIVPSTALAAPSKPRHVDDAVLVDPPAAGEKLAVSLFSEPADADVSKWPGRTGMNSQIVGRITMHTDQGLPLLHFTAVSWTTKLQDEDLLIQRMAQAKVVNTITGERLKGARALLFGFVDDIDGHPLPWLADLPVGNTS